MNAQLSQQILNEGLAGKVINRHRVTPTGIEPNPIFNELFENLEAYMELYRYLPFEIRSVSGAGFYIQQSNQEGPYLDVARNIQVLLDLLARGMQEMGILPDAIDHTGPGIPEAHLEAFSLKEDFRDILHACGMKNDLVDEIRNVLARRDIAYFTDTGRLKLTDTGRAFFDELHDVG